MIQYVDFSIKIEPKRGDVYPVIVLQSPAGECRSSFRLPFDVDELGDILFDLGESVRGSGQVTVRDASPAATRTPPQQIGDQLFDALFSGSARSLLDRSLGMIHGQQRGLRIKVHIDPEEPSLAQLASLPWELLYHKETRDFLNLSRYTPVIRYLDVQRPHVPLSLEPPLRILVVISGPVDYAWLDLEGERKQIEENWAKQKGVEVEFLETKNKATAIALQDRLAQRPYHVLHYMGHGGFDRQAGRGVLVMEDETGHGTMVDGSTLAVLLRDVHTMRLVFLNACETARVTKEEGLDPFAGVASAMVMAGIPAVVAMQFPITDRAAIQFANRFYPLLARGHPVDYAVAEGRQAIRLARGRTSAMEWATPVLFMRAPQGVIFEAAEAERVGQPESRQPESRLPELPSEIDKETEERLEQLYTAALSAFWLENWDQACHYFEAIVAVRPDYQDVDDKLNEACRQNRLGELYAEAQDAQHAEEWARALVVLEDLVAEAADYEDAADQLEEVRKQKELADLYAEARHLHQVQQWQAVINVFSQIYAIEPNYADPEGLLAAAEAIVAEQGRQAKLDSLYRGALGAMEVGQLLEARQLWKQVREIEPDYGDAEQLLVRVEAELAQDEAERKRQDEIAEAYEEARARVSAGQWPQALVAMEEIRALDSGFDDPEGLAARARAALEKEEEEARRQENLSALYAAAVQLLGAGQYQDALDKWGEVQALDPNYPDRKKVQVTARKKLDRLSKPAAERRLPWWVLAGIGGIALIAMGAFIIFGIGGGDGGSSKPTPAVPVLVLVDDTDTPSPTPSQPPTEIPSPTHTPIPFQPSLTNTPANIPAPAHTANLTLTPTASPTHTRTPTATPTRTHTPTATPTRTPTSTAAPASHAHYGHLAFTSNRDGNPEIYVVNLADGNPVRLTKNNTNDWLPDWSPDGSRIAFTSNRTDNYDTWVMNGDGTGQKSWVTTGAWDEYARWARDGQRLSFSSTAVTEGIPNSEIFVRQASGDLTQATYSTAENQWADWSPDGRIIYTEGFKESSDWDIYIAEADGSNRTAWLDMGTCDVQPTWSPDGQWIAFLRISRDTNGNGRIDFEDAGDVWVGKASGGDLRQLTLGLWVSTLAWSPDGKWIAHARTRDSNSNGRSDSKDAADIWAVSFSGEDAIPLVQSPHRDVDPTWAR